VNSVLELLPSFATSDEAESIYLAAAHEVDVVARAIEQGELHREAELVAAFDRLAAMIVEIRRRQVTSVIGRDVSTPVARRSITIRVWDIDGRLVAELKIRNEGVPRNGRWTLHGASGTQGPLTFTFYDGLSGSVIPADEVPNRSEYILSLLEKKKRPHRAAQG
jgi:2-methylaconitate cis-trans-isomerase PrpF